MTVADQHPPKLCLTLSGGGFRATLFHLGVVRFLYETGRLASVKCIGAVSGGSILAAHLALNWDRYTGDNEVFDAAAREVVRFAASDVRGRVVRRWFLAWLTMIPRLLMRRHWTFTNLLQRTYVELYGDRTLRDLQPSQGVARPEVFFYTTSLTTGSVCSFGGSRFFWVDEDGRERNILAPTTPVAFAVAASSAFPPLFPPIAVSNDVLSCDVREFPNPQYLTDGGVYDNLGIERLYRSRANDVDLFVVSDAEGNVDWDFSKKYSFITTRNVRASDLLMKRVSTLMYETLAPHREQLVVLDMDLEVQRPDDPSILDPSIQRSLRNMRTDLDTFSPVEALCLVQHGFAVARERLGSGGPSSTAPPSFSWNLLPSGVTSQAHQLRDIRRSRERKLRLWSARDWASWASLLPVALVLAVLVGWQLSLAQQASEARRVSALNEKLTEVAIEYYRRRIRPVEPATSIGHVKGTAGTICCVVRPKNGGPQRYLLGADPLFPSDYKLGDAVLQPGPADGGKEETDTVARLHKVLEPNPTGTSLLVGALAEVLPNVGTAKSISGIGPITGVIERLEVGQEVLVTGRTSGIVRAVVMDVNASFKVHYAEGKDYQFGQLIAIKAKSEASATKGGDGGAPVLTLDGKLAGMIFAGSPTLSLAVPIKRLLDAFEVELDQ